MATFATESDVREKFQLTDTNTVSSALVVRGLNDANTDILRVLDDDVDTVTPEAGLIMGEALLAGAYVLRSLASGDAFSQKNLSLGTARVAGGDRFGDMSKAAEVAESQAWYVLEPYVSEMPEKPVASVTDTQPVLGEE